MKVNLKQIAGIRVAASGSVTIAANTTVVLLTTTRQATERLLPSGFVTNTTSTIWGEETVVGVSGDRVSFGFLSGVIVDQYKFAAKNNNVALGPSRTLDWLIIAVKP